MPSSSRVLSPYERNHLLRHGVNPDDISAHGEMPVEYITGQVTFCGQTFFVNSSVLLPRVETEELIQLITTDPRMVTASPLTIIDIGTGSGAIGLSLALQWQHTKELELHLSDISPAALEVAKKNAHHLGLATDQIHFWLSDIWEHVPQQRFDLVVANLPYIPSARIPTLSESVKNFEPHLALDGGSDGLVLISSLLEKLESYLAPQGVCWLEVDETHDPAQLKQKYPHFEVTGVVDSFGASRFVRLTLRQ